MKRLSLPIQYRIQLALGTLTLTAGAQAQGLQSAYVNNTTDPDSVWLFQDLNQDGDYEDAGEMTNFYDDVQGSIVLSSHQGNAIRPDGSLLVSDGTEDIIVLLQDLNGNGDALDNGEAKIWFDGNPLNNAGGIEMASARNMWVDPDMVTWVAVANAGNGGIDMILRLEDLDSSGSANGPGEALVYYQVLPGAALGDSIPADVQRGADGALYYLEAGDTAGHPKGVYRLEDLDQSGSIDQPGEETLFFVPTAQALNGFAWKLSQDANGVFSIADNINEIIWRFEDTDNNGTVDPISEASIYWMGAASSNIWSFQYGDNGAIYAVEDQTPDRLLYMFDANMDGSIDPLTEVTETYNDTVNPQNIGSPRAITLIPREMSIGTAYCDPAVVNSTGQPGTLEALGSLVAASNSVTLRAASLPLGEFGYFLNGTGSTSVPMAGGSAGTLCVGTSIGRYNKIAEIFNSGTLGTGSLVLDLNSTPTPTVPTQVLAGQTWYFQCWYRDTAQTSSNFTNGVQITFQ
ncbi:MAG: hypothetical protein H6830_01300 [Planctomycetes bacterium]|nr:hypothetical protein [Planctomycetota bacterium]MCB9910896.1 hypothetical protein [Planctomycetota bacterium]MCB9912107.1 hypothetical protein [Planctomycetota bacterium]